MVSEKRQLTAVIAALDTYALVKDVLLWLHQQTARSQLHIIVVCQQLSQFGIPNNFEDEIGPVQFVECGLGKTLAEARAYGAREATSPYIVFFEDHAFPEPAWAERVLERLEQGWTGVGGAFLLANPQSILAQGLFLVGYGQWLYPVQAQEMAFVSGHGTAFRREVLMENDEELEAYLLAESRLMADLRKQGHRFFCESDVVCWHFDSSRWLGAIKISTTVGRLLAAQRSATWPAWQRVVFGFACPLIALLRWKRAVFAYVRTRGLKQFSPLSVPVTAVISCLWAWGEWLGFWFDFGNSRQKISDLEHNRKRHLRPNEWPIPRRSGRMTADDFRCRTAHIEK